MSVLVDLALEFVAKHINEIILLPIDMNCMNSNLYKRLAFRLSLSELNEIEDRKDKLKS